MCGYPKKQTYAYILTGKKSFLSCAPRDYAVRRDVIINTVPTLRLKTRRVFFFFFVKHYA